MDGRTLRIFRDGRKHDKTLSKPIPRGAAGNMETLAEMAKIVREDALESDIGVFVNRYIIGNARSLNQKIEKVFTFARDAIIYDQEKNGNETEADLWSCLFALNPNNPQGDCAVKSVFIATCLSYLGLKPKFVAIQQVPKANYFNHVFVQVEAEGKTIILDATPKEFRVGDELESFARLIYPIF